MKARRVGGGVEKPPLYRGVLIRLDRGILPRRGDDGVLVGAFRLDPRLQHGLRTELMLVRRATPGRRLALRRR